MTARWSQRILFAFSFVLLGYCVYVMAGAWIFQRQAKADLNRVRYTAHTASPIAAAVQPELAEPFPEPGALLGKVEVERLGVSVALVEGTDAAALERAAGHIEGTALPGRIGNIGIAAHRDTFFRPLRNIHSGDVIQIVAPNDTYRYRVTSTKIVKPDDVSVLMADGSEVLTLVTCYPFYYVGPAPTRFIVRAERMPDAIGNPPVVSSRF